jgi:glycosyltransferase involved in cell wall biosynthesis
LENRKNIVKKVKVLNLITGIDVGGAERYLLSTVRILDRMRFEVVVCFLRGNGTLRSEFEASGIAVQDFSGSWWSILARTFRLFTFIRSERFDIVHTHLIRATLVGRILSRLASTPVVFTTEHNVSNWQQRYFVVTLFYRWTGRNVYRIFAISNAVKDSLVTVGRIDPKRIEVLLPGVDLAEFSQKSTSPSGNPSVAISDASPVIGCVGRFDPRKGHRVLVDAAVKLREYYPRLKLFLVGDGEMRSAIESQVERLGLRSSVVFSGTQRTVRDFLQSFDVVVFPSLSEGLGVAILEAMAMGKLIVATRVGGIPEAITDRLEGRLVEPGNSELLAQTIREVLTDRIAARRMMAAAKAKCRKEFDVHIAVRRLESVYIESLKATGSLAGSIQ